MRSCIQSIAGPHREAEELGRPCPLNKGHASIIDSVGAGTLYEYYFCNSPETIYATPSIVHSSASAVEEYAESEKNLQHT